MASNVDNETFDLLSNEELDALLVSFDFNLNAEEVKEDTKINCSFCVKVCASQRGLDRHLQCKHPETLTASSTSSSSSNAIEEIIHQLAFKKILVQSVTKLSNDECYPVAITDQFKNFESSNQVVRTLYQLITPVILKFKGDAEKFYPDFCVLFRGGNIIDSLDHHCNVLLGFELANNVLAFLTKSKIIDDSLTFEFQNADLSQKDKEVISYLSGYVIATLYKRLRFSKKAKRMYHQQCLSLLKACKYVDGSETDTSNQKLINTKDRGGLWRVKSDVQRIFTFAESYFLSSTREFVTKINAKHIVSKLMQDMYVLAYFNTIRKSSEENIKKEIGLNLLEDMLTLYIRLRSHSYAKDKQQLHKISKDVTKTRSLRTEIKKKSSVLDTGH